MTFTRTRLVLIAATALCAAAAPALAAPSGHHGTMSRHEAAARPDALRAKLDARITTVDAKLTAARRAGRISAANEAKLRRQISGVRMDSARLARQQGFLSAAESASYNRTLDQVEHALHG